MWIFRGNDIPPIMKEECYDLELYNWNKVDPSDPVSPSIRSLSRVLVLCLDSNI